MAKEQLNNLTIKQMSTYLLAFANGEFVHLESSYKSPLSGKVRPLRIYGMVSYFDCLSRYIDYLPC